MTPYWSVLGSMPLLIAKLSLVLLLVVLISINSSLVRKAKKGDAAVHLAKLASLGRVSLITGITIVLLAVLVFR